MTATVVQGRFKRYASELMNALLFLAAHFIQPFLAGGVNKRLLIVRTDSIGDFILFSGCLQYYRQLYHDYEITLVVRSEVVPLAETCPHIDRVWALDWHRVRGSLSQRSRWMWQVVTAGFDTVINAVYSPNFHLAEAFVGWSLAPRRVAFSCAGLRRGYAEYYTELVPDHADSMFELDRNFELLRYLGYSEGVDRSLFIWTTADDGAAAEKIMASIGNGRFGMLFPGARDRMRRWSVNKFVQAISASSNAKNITWLVCGAMEEADICEELTKGLRTETVEAVSLAGKLDLRVAALVMGKATVCFANESMAVHMAAAMGTPVVCILGGGHYGRFYPYPGNSLTFAVTNVLGCYRCGWDCTQKYVSCLEDISAEQAAAVLDPLLSRCPGDH